MLEQLLTSLLQQYGLSKTSAGVLAMAATLIGTCTIALILTALFRRILVRSIGKWLLSSQYKWDDLLVEHRVIYRLSWFVPLLLVAALSSLLFTPSSTTSALVDQGLRIGYVIVLMRLVHSILSFANALYAHIKKIPASPYQGYTDAAVVIAYIVGAIAIAAILTGKSIVGVLSVLGGLTAVTILVFKDTLLNFTAAIQLNATDMIRVGDWIEMDKYGADGDVIQTSLNTIRVQNWDKTITTIPTYALVASSFKNWRGMTESGGRRIKRSLLIDQTSVSFCSDDLLEKLGHVEILQDYLMEKTAELESYNYLKKIDTDSSILNGRRQTNLGLFRAYIIAYLKNQPKLSPNMTFLVRHKAPTENGLPLEIYVFSRDKVWANYESIQADIFDHLLAAIPEFQLRLYQRPSGADFHHLL